MTKQEKAQGILRWAETIGTSFRFDSGFVLATFPVGVSAPERLAIMEKLSSYIAEIRDVLLKRAIAVRGRELVGSRVYSQERGMCSLTACGGSADLTVSAVPKENRSGRSLSTLDYAENLIVVQEERETESEGSRSGVKLARTAPADDR